jgi:hypothetical protein
MGKTSQTFIRAGNQPRITGGTIGPKSAGNSDSKWMRPPQPKYTGGTSKTVKNYGAQTNLDPSGITTK